MTRKLTKIFTGLALLFCIRGQSQSVTPSVLNAAGGTYDNPAMYTHFEWNFGELAVTETYAGSPLTLTNGLLQPCTDVVGASPEILLFGSNEWKIFPNVTPGPFELDFFLNIPGTMELQLTDATGRVLNTRRFEYHCCDRIERYDISRYANGVYFINARFTPGRYNPPDILSTRRESTFKVVKAGK
jgi:hypothetical protein